MNKLLSVAAAAAVSSCAFGSLTYNQNFDSMGSTNQTVVGSGAINAQGVIAGLDGLWQAARIAGTGSTALVATSNDGSGNSGGIFNYAQPSSDPDRALGALASNSTTAAFGVAITNTSGLTLDTITITFDAMMFRTSTVAVNKLLFAYGFSSGSATATDFLSSSGLTADAQGDIVGGTPVPSNGVLNPAASTLVSFTLTSIVWTDGSTLFLRWSDFNDGGNDAGLAIDNFSLVAVPTPGSLALLGVAGLVARRRR
ncbi:MAG: hypothetical protein GC172_01925 [Phycisphaera sp.]|nr:hypothetical protein [Phycisphaera sp.]